MLFLAEGTGIRGNRCALLYQYNHCLQLERNHGMNTFEKKSKTSFKKSRNEHGSSNIAN